VTKEPTSETLVCIECDTVAPEPAEGWKAEIGDDLRDDDPPEVLILCPECWDREFGASDYLGVSAPRLDRRPRAPTRHFPAKLDAWSLER
jgi:hypothetical protein